MVSRSRLDWIIKHIHSGRSAVASFSFNHDTGKEKVKFILEDKLFASAPYRPSLFGAINAVAIAMHDSVVTDKGHKSSNGRTIIEFWIAAPGASSQVDERVQNVSSTAHVTDPTDELASQAVSMLGDVWVPTPLASDAVAREVEDNLQDNDVQGDDLQTVGAREDVSDFRNEREEDASSYSALSTAVQA